MRVSKVEQQVVVEYLRARAKAEAGSQDCHPDSLMLSKTADLVIRLGEAVDSLSDRCVSLQRQVGEYECREMQG